MLCSRTFATVILAQGWTSCVRSASRIKATAVCRNGFEGETCKGIEPYNNRLTPGVWRVLWISSDYGDDGIGAKSKKFPTVSNTPPPPTKKKINGLKINPPPARAKHNNNNNNNNNSNNKKTNRITRSTHAGTFRLPKRENICQIFLPPKISVSHRRKLFLISWLIKC